MRASEVLERYAAGERDFRRINIRGQAFVGKDLSGSDFRDADIRGTNFTKSSLRDADLSCTHAGLQRRWASCLIAVSFFLSMLSGAACLLAGIMTAGIASPTFIHEYKIIPAGILLVVLIIYYAFVFRRGFLLGLVSCALSLSASIAIIGTLTSSLAGSGVAALAVAWAVVGTFTGAIAIVIVGAVARSEALIVLLVCLEISCQVLAGTAAWLVAGIVANNGIGAAPGKAAVAKSVIIAKAFAAKVGAESVGFALGGTWDEMTARFFAIVVACSLVLLGIYSGIQALKIDEEAILIHRIGIFIASTGGTNFYKTNLTNANFGEATLKNTNFTDANLKRTYFLRAKKLECSRIGSTYLKDPQIRKLITTGEGQEQNFDRKTIEGLNLHGANLRYASFIGANLSKTNLQDTNLFGAKLVQTQLERTDFTGAILTGAYIEDWGITIGTKFDNVECEYVYMRLPTRDDPDPCRKPDNRNEVFRIGDFADFIAPIFKTLDLYHNQGVDPRAIAIAFKHLIENNPAAELELVAMEKRGLDKFLLRAKTAEGVNRSELSAEYFSEYNQLKTLPQNDAQLLVAAQDERIRSLENMLITALKQPKFYAETYQNQGAFMPEQSGTHVNVGGNVVGSTINLGEISGAVSNVVNQLSEPSEPGQPNIKHLLTQLQKAIEDETELLPEDRADLLEQVKAFAEAKQTSKHEEKEGLTRKARKIFEATLRGLPDTAKIVEACSRLLPMILQALGF